METDCPAVVSPLITAETTLLANTTDTAPGTVLGLRCVSGFSLQGAPLLRCTTSGAWDQDTPTCVQATTLLATTTTTTTTTTSGPPPTTTATSLTADGWLLNLTQADVIVLGVCCALLLFLVVLTVVVCFLYRRRAPPRGGYRKQRHLRRRRRRRHSTSSCTSLSSESELPVWNTQTGQWQGPRRQPSARTHRSWAGVMPSYYPSYVTNYPMTSPHAASADYPMTQQFHWYPVGEGRRQTRYQDTGQVLNPHDLGQLRTPFTSSYPSRLTPHYPLPSSYNPFRYETRKTGWPDGLDYNRQGIPRAQVRSDQVVHSNLSLDQTLFDDDRTQRSRGRAARDKRAEAERKL